jgi:23S rRNA (cytosine1962-C5)-methyltransferase
VADRNVAVRVTGDALRRIRSGHPWVFDGSVVSAKPAGAAGDLAVVFDDQRRFAAIGLWDPDSPIRVKVLQHGAPMTVDAGFWHERIVTAMERRASLVADSTTNGYRCVNGESDGMPALVVDRYADTAVVKVYRPIWFPHLDDVVAAVVSVVGVSRVVLRLARQVEPVGDRVDGAVLRGAPIDGPVVFRERGLRFEADVVHGNKTGHFLDQRDNRALVRAASSGARVLDVFASSGGFSVAAAAGGATAVHLVDVSAPALAAARRNLELNHGIREVRSCEVRTTRGDAFAVLGELGRTERGAYDVVVLDPPSFAQNQRSVPRALESYARLTTLGLRLVRPGGLLVQASCSSRVGADQFVDTVLGAAARAGVELLVERRTGHPVDHPVTFDEGAYLKAVFARVVA